MMGRDWFHSRKPKVVTIPVQDGNTIPPYSGHLQERKSTLPKDIPCRQPGYAEGSSHRRNVVKSSENLKTMCSLRNPRAGNDVPRATMSENAAAILIQSHVRGYMVRRTDPLNSLRAISSVRSQLRKLKAQISSDEYMHKLRADPKEHKQLSETIMSLLLRLDGLQNVHPTVREIRRSAVRELVALQDRVDLQLQHDRAEIPEDSKALPGVEYNNCSVDGSDFLLFQMIKIRIRTRILHL